MPVPPSKCGHFLPHMGEAIGSQGGSIIGPHSISDSFHSSRLFPPESIVEARETEFKSCIFFTLVGPWASSSLGSSVERRSNQQ